MSWMFLFICRHFFGIGVFSVFAWHEFHIIKVKEKKYWRVSSIYSITIHLVYTICYGNIVSCRRLTSKCRTISSMVRCLHSIKYAIEFTSVAVLRLDFVSDVSVASSICYEYASKSRLVWFGVRAKESNNSQGPPREKWKAVQWLCISRHCTVLTMNVCGRFVIRETRGCHTEDHQSRSGNWTPSVKANKKKKKKLSARVIDRHSRLLRKSPSEYFLSQNCSL